MSGKHVFEMQELHKKYGALHDLSISLFGFMICSIPNHKSQAMSYGSRPTN